MEHFNWHCLFLTPEETDQFFEPFNQSNYEMPSHLYRIGHRYIKEPVYEWLTENVGDAAVAWRSEGSRSSRELLFVDKDKAMLFKMTFQ